MMEYNERQRRFRIANLLERVGNYYKNGKIDDKELKKEIGRIYREL